MLRMQKPPLTLQPKRANDRILSPLQDRSFQTERALRHAGLFLFVDNLDKVFITTSGLGGLCPAGSIHGALT